MAEFKAVKLYKGGNEYLCETEERLERFQAAGWKKTKPKADKAPQDPPAGDSAGEAGEGDTGEE